MKKEHLLVILGKEYFKSESARPEEAPILPDEEENKFISDLEHYPHAFVLACCMDRQVSAERAWRIPWVIKNLCGEFTIAELSKISLKEYTAIFTEQSLHRFNGKMAEVFYDAVLRIKKQYGGDASLIWSGCPSSAAVVYRFLQFNGIGVKIATMATNLLVRRFKVKLSDYYSIDVSPDVHVNRIFKRCGLVEENANRDCIIYKARELFPRYPGIVDSPCWHIGQKYCRPSSPDCGNCPLCSVCDYALGLGAKRD